MAASIRLSVAVVLVAAATLRAGEYRVPLMAKPPVINGKIEPDEWRLAAGLDGFAFRGQADRRRARGYVGATATHLYFACEVTDDEGAYHIEAVVPLS